MPHSNPVNLLQPGPKPGRVHFAGIAGSGMRSLANLLAERGWAVTGSDSDAVAIETLSARHPRWRLAAGHNAANVDAPIDALVYSSAVPAENAERRRALELGIPQHSYVDVLAEFTRYKRSVCITGSHGKSTTTALTGWILREASFSPSMICGAELRGLNTGGWSGQSDLFVLESCEYRRHFLRYTAETACILNVEPDHFDCYPTLDSCLESFAQFAAGVPPDGLLAVNADCPSAMASVAAATCRVESIGLHPTADWSARDVRQSPNGLCFTIQHSGVEPGRFHVPLFGRHNVRNALAAVVLAHRAGASFDDIRESVRSFPGLRRRFEVTQASGLTLIDDYAHHPTAIDAVLQTVRSLYRRRRVWCVFQPHQVSRTRALLCEFAASLHAADRVLVPPVYAARESAGNDDVRLARELARRAGSHARFTPSLDRVLTTLHDEARPGDVVVTLGAGNVDRVCHELSRRIPRHHAA